MLWLDDLTPAHLAQLDRTLLNNLPQNLWILATVCAKHLRGFRIPEHVKLLLEERAVVVRLGTISGQERNALLAENAYAPLQPVLGSGGDLLMGRLMVAFDQIQKLLIPGTTEDASDRVALLRVVTDWYRIAMPARLTRRVLKDLYADYRRQIAGQDDDWPVSVSRFERALTWATRASHQRPQLVDLEKIRRAVWYVPHRLLAVIADDADMPGAWPVSDTLWGSYSASVKGAKSNAYAKGKVSYSGIYLHLRIICRLSHATCVTSSPSSGDREESSPC